MKIKIIKIEELETKKLESCLKLIDIEKREKIEKLVLKKDRIRSLVGDIVVRLELINFYKLTNKDISFSVNRYGKPFLKENIKFYFNISHSGDFVIVAIGDEAKIGVDIEKKEEFSEYLEIATEFFNPREVDYIENYSKEKLKDFYKIWVAKEAYIKFVGKGLSEDLKSFCVEGSKDKWEIKKENSKVKLVSLQIHKDYEAAVCFSSDSQVSVKMITMENIINEFLAKGE